MLLLLDVGFRFVLQQHRECLLIFGVHRRAGQFTEHLVGEVGASPPAYRPCAAGAPEKVLGQW